MRRGTNAIAAAAFSITACNQTADRPAASNAEEPATAAPSEIGAPAPPPATRSEPRTSLAEPKGQIDPKSAEAAGQVVQHYGALIEQGRWAEAEKLWSDKTVAAKFAAELQKNREVHLEIGDLGDTEGAAGSIYITAPVTLYGKDTNGQPFKALRTVILRRVNDVPGSSEEERRWHIVGLETGWTPKSR
jgi:hypothetical protein